MEWLEHLFIFNQNVIYKIIFSLSILVILITIKYFINKKINNSNDNIKKKYIWRKFSSYILFFLGFIIIIIIWSDRFASLLAFIGLFSAGLAIALRDFFASLFAWFFILWRKPFTIGDRIEIAETAGDVIDIRLFQFSLIEIGNWVDGDQSTGRVVHLPNSKVLNNKIANYTAGFRFIWNEIFVLLTFESDWLKAKSILSQRRY